MNKTFVNDSFSEALDLYLKYKDHPDLALYNSFLVVVIRTLVFIYSELDIVNPYITFNESNMGGLDENLKKYGLSDKLLKKFKEAFISFKDSINTSPNKAFLDIEKILVEMYVLKVKSVGLDNSNLDSFKQLLYLSSTSNNYMKSDLDKYLTKKDIIDKYLNFKLFSINNNFNLENVKRHTLRDEAYMLLGYNMSQVNSFTDQDLKRVNEEIYRFFRVDSNESNRDVLLDKAVEYYKRYGNKVTTGNGFVDLLVYASVLATVVFITVLFVYKYL